MLWLVRKAFFGHVPFPVVHVDTGMKLPRCTSSATATRAEWDLDLVSSTARRERRSTRPCRRPPAPPRARPKV